MMQLGQYTLQRRNGAGEHGTTKINLHCVGNIEDPGEWIASVPGTPAAQSVAGHIFCMLFLQQGDSDRELEVFDDLQARGLPMSYEAYLVLLNMLLRECEYEVASRVYKSLQSRFPTQTPQLQEKDELHTALRLFFLQGNIFDVMESRGFVDGGARRRLRVDEHGQGGQVSVDEDGQDTLIWFSGCPRRASRACVPYTPAHSRALLPLAPGLHLCVSCPSLRPPHLMRRGQGRSGRDTATCMSRMCVHGGTMNTENVRMMLMAQARMQNEVSNGTRLHLNLDVNFFEETCGRGVWGNRSGSCQRRACGHPPMGAGARGDGTECRHGRKTHRDDYRCSQRT